jgi:hypothetical protein
MSPHEKQILIKLDCPHCGNLGAVHWQTGADGNRRVLDLHGAFHQETDRIGPGEPVIVCSLCDQIQPG